LFLDFGGFVAMATKFGSFLPKFKLASSFLFIDRIEPFSGHQFNMTPSTKRFS